jgi:hypothetical protein
MLAERIARDLHPAGRRSDDRHVPTFDDVKREAIDAHLVASSVVDVDVNSVCLDLDDRRPQARATVLGADDLDERRGDRLPLPGL